jgi:hypothetical protein
MQQLGLPEILERHLKVDGLHEGRILRAIISPDPPNPRYPCPNLELLCGPGAGCQIAKIGLK